MNKKEIKRIVNETFDKSTPDFLSKIKAECQNIKQIEPEKEVYKVDIISKPKSIYKKLAYGMLCCVLFVVGIIVGNINFNKVNIESSIYLDVNPSIEIQMDSNNLVIECLGLNEDGKNILDDVSLKGVEINTALYAVVGLMYTNGYLNENTNSILVSVESKSNETILLDQISNQINNVFKDNEDMSCSIIAQKVSTDEELKNKADNQKISIGKMSLIDKIINNSNLYTEDNLDTLAKMSIHELDLIYQSMNTNEPKDDEYITGKPGGFIDYNDMLPYIIDYLKIDSKYIKNYEVVALYNRDEANKPQLVYLVSITIQGQGKIKLIVNCSTGEIMSEDSIDDFKDKIKDDGNFWGPNKK